MPRSLRCLLLAISCVFQIECTPRPPDVPACEHLGQRLTVDPVTGHDMLEASPTCMQEIQERECGFCVYIVSGRKIFIGENAPHLLNGKPWSKIRTQSILLPAVESYAPLSAYIINSCKKMNCDDDVARFRVKLGTLKTAASAVSDPEKAALP